MKIRSHPGPLCGFAVALTMGIGATAVAGLRSGRTVTVTTTWT
jgi:hypothetical protein